MGEGIKVEIYAHDPGEGWPGQMKKSEVRDVTSWVTSLSAVLSVDAPWESLSVSMSMPWAQLPFVLPGLPLTQIWGDAHPEARIPGTGYYLVVRSYHGGLPAGRQWPALWWGRVTGVSAPVSLSPDGGRASCKVRLQASSWWGVVDASDLLLFLEEKTRLRGLVENFKGWAKIFKDASVRAFTQTPGAVLDHLWRDLLSLVLPETLTGGVQRDMASQIPLVHDRATCDRWAPMRLALTQRVPGRATQEMGLRWFGGKLGRFLRSSFEADPELVECFPSLEFPYKDLDLDPVDLEDGEGVLASRGRGTGEQTHLGLGLGSQPVMIYRMRPTLLDAVNNAGLEAAARNWAQRAAQETGHETSWGQEPFAIVDGWRTGWFHVAADDLGGFEPTISDGDRVNVAYVAPSVPPGGGTMDAYGRFGEPVESRPDMIRNGARAMLPRWPFWQVEEKGQLSPHLYRNASATTEIAYQMGASEGVQGEPATVRVRLGRPRLWVRAGYWWSVDLGPDAGPLNTIVGYGAQVEHSVTMVEGAVKSASTSVTLRRATLGTHFATLHPRAARAAGGEP